MPLDAELLELLACPSADHAPLREETHDGAEVLVCSYCASRYPIEDGIPVLLLDEAVPGPNGVGNDASAKPSAG
ncbi:MAG TPA: Trm112 family protein [Jatrophihabitans sp.]|nr:Trm112 family protein [Jatrophihabitans sp.]